VSANPAAVSAWAGLVALAVGFVTLVYLIKYTRRTGELRDEAKSQTRIQSEMYEASVMPLLVAEFGSWQEGTNPTTDAVLIRNLGRGPALGVLVDPITVGDLQVRFDYIPIIECGGTKPLVCVKDTPMPEGYSRVQQLIDDHTAGDSSNHNASSFLHRYARSYMLAHDSKNGDIKVVARSLSNTAHEFRFSVELRGSDDFAVLVYQGKSSLSGD
jgi:hypothetical protein